MKRLFIQTQLSNYTKEGKFVLECDSGWQMVAGRIREFLKLNPYLYIDVTGPERDQLITQPEDITSEIRDPRVRYIEHYIPANALLSRHHFDVQELEFLKFIKYDAAYINDPMQFRNYKALLDCKFFAVHNHFIDNPSCPKFPKETSLWLGQCEAIKRADLNFWQCESAISAFVEDAGYYPPKSFAWDDGYSDTELQTIDMNNVRFDPKLLTEKPIIFVPNRVGGKGVSSDYTNCGKFLFEILPKIKGDFNVVAGNPSQKFRNDQLPVLQLVPGTLNRDEYKLVAKNSSIVVALYDQDTYGGTAARECIALGCLPLWLDCNEYADISRKAMYPYACTWDTIVETVEKLLTLPKTERMLRLLGLQSVIYNRCALEVTTKAAAERMNIL